MESNTFKKIQRRSKYILAALFAACLVGGGLLIAGGIFYQTPLAAVLGIIVLAGGPGLLFDSWKTKKSI